MPCGIEVAQPRPQAARVAIGDRLLQAGLAARLGDRVLLAGSGFRACDAGHRIQDLRAALTSQSANLANAIGYMVTAECQQCHRRIRLNARSHVDWVHVPWVPESASPGSWSTPRNAGHLTVSTQAVATWRC
jgi:hypothetical protein